MDETAMTIQPTPQLLARRIIVAQRSHDYHACIEGEPGLWGCGKSKSEALGQLLLAHARGMIVFNPKFAVDGVLREPDTEESEMEQARRLR